MCGRELKLKNDSHRLESPVQRASGEKLELVGQCTMMIKIDGGGVCVCVRVSAAHTILRVLLGADFLSRNHCVLGLQQQVLYAGRKHVYMCPPDCGVH